MVCDKCGRVVGTDPEDNPAYEVNLLVHEGPGDSPQDFFRGDTIGVYCGDCLKGVWT